MGLESKNGVPKGVLCPPKVGSKTLLSSTQKRSRRPKTERLLLFLCLERLKIVQIRGIVVPATVELKAGHVYQFVVLVHLHAKHAVAIGPAAHGTV